VVCVFARKTSEPLASLVKQIDENIGENNNLKSFVVIVPKKGDKPADDLKKLAHDAGIDILHVPYKSSPQALEDVIAGRVSMMIVDFTVGMPHVAAGQVRALAMTRLKRSTLYPDLPTMDEAGVKGFELDAWAGLVAPAKTPPDVVAKLNGALRKVINDPDVQAKFKNVGFDAYSSTPEEFGDFIKVQLGNWSKMVKDANIQAE